MNIKLVFLIDFIGEKVYIEQPIDYKVKDKKTRY